MRRKIKKDHTVVAFFPQLFDFNIFLAFLGKGWCDIPCAAQGRGTSLDKARRKLIANDMVCFFSWCLNNAIKLTLILSLVLKMRMIKMLYMMRNDLSEEEHQNEDTHTFFFAQVITTIHLMSSSLREWRAMFLEIYQHGK